MTWGTAVEDEPPWSAWEKDDVTALIEKQNGIIAWWQAIRHLSPKAVEHKVASGRWRRVVRGVYVTYGGPLTVPQRQWIAVLAAGPSGGDNRPVLLGGISALQVHGLRGITSSTVHLIVAQGRKTVARPGVTVHRMSIAEEDRYAVPWPPLTAIGRSVVDAASWARSDDVARLVIAAAFQQRLVTAPEIVQVLDRMPTARRRLLVLETTRDAAGGSHSLGELHFVAICRDFRLPLPSRQVTFIDSRGRRRYLDAVFDEWHAAIEVDGAHHDDDIVQRWDDLGRDTDLQLAGFRILRLTLHEVRRDRGSAARKLRALLELEGWRP
jgi:hypothetical protein